MLGSAAVQAEKNPKRNSLLLLLLVFLVVLLTLLCGVLFQFMVDTKVSFKALYSSYDPHYKPVVLKPSSADVKHIVKRMKYWRPINEQKPINEERWLVFEPWAAGINNRRMSLETMVVMAYLTNRTLVLPKPYVQYPYLQKVSYTHLWDIEDMARAVPIVEFDYFENNYAASHPGWYDENNPQVMFVCRWTDIPQQQTIFAWPRVPVIATPLRDMMEKWRAPKIGTLYSSEPPGFNTAPVLHFPGSVVFTHFYTWYWYSEPIMFKQVAQLMKDYVHFVPEVYVLSARILAAMPKTFSTIHYRRGDFQYKDQRHITPNQVFENTFELFEEGEDIYVATDEDMKVFKRDFIPVFEKRYKVHYYGMYEDLIKSDVTNVWLPMVETVISSQGRVFVGTLLSTFSGYITRLRGYMPQVENKEYYWTCYKYPNDPGYTDGPFTSENHLHGWGREYPDAWSGLATVEPEMNDSK